MFDRKSDYALNKRHPDSIVCKSVTDVHIYLTRADFSSEADFLKWKEWSDRNYHQMDKAGRGFYDNCLPLDERYLSNAICSFLRAFSNEFLVNCTCSIA